MLVAMPPVRGDLLLVPLAGGARAQMLPLAIARGALLVGRGPLPGSLIVRGTHARLGAALAAAGILTLAAPAAACGQKDVSHADR